ncbi:MAG: hypothetical protein V7731_07655 [Amphritea sp.]
MSLTYMTAKELGAKIKYHPKYINDALRDSVFIEGKHYVRPFGGRKVLYVWEAVEEEMLTRTAVLAEDTIPMASGGCCHG